MTSDSIGKHRVRALAVVRMKTAESDAAVRVGAAPGLMSKLRRRLKGLNGPIAFVAWISLMLVIPA